VAVVGVRGAAIGTSRGTETDGTSVRRRSRLADTAPGAEEASAATTAATATRIRFPGARLMSPQRLHVTQDRCWRRAGMERSDSF
jgi:hypothetical protein